MPLTTATWDSVNVIFAQLDLDVGPENVTKTAHDMGIEAPLESVPAEAIGGLRYGVTPLEMADAYATLASGGIHHAPTAIDRVEFPDGDVDEADNESGDRVLTEGQAYEVTKILEGVITSGHRRRLHLHGMHGGGGQDGHLRGPLRRLVRRLHAALLDRGLGRPPAVARRDRLRRARRPARSGARSWNRPWAANCPEFEEPDQPARTLRPEQRTHPLLLGSRSRDRTERRTGRKRRRARRAKARKKEGEEGGGNEPAPAPDPGPGADSGPGAHARPRRPRKASAAASPRRPVSRRADRWHRRRIARLDCRRCRFGNSQRFARGALVSLLAARLDGSRRARGRRPLPDPAVRPAPTTKIVAGPDGNMWVTVNEGGKRRRPDQARRHASTNSNWKAIEGASGIAVGPEGTHVGHRRSTSVASFLASRPERRRAKRPTIADVTSNSPIVAGPDGQMWVAATENVVHFSPADPTKTTPFTVAELSPKDIDVAGSLLVDRRLRQQPDRDDDDRRRSHRTSRCSDDHGTSQGVAGSPNGQIAFSDSRTAPRASAWSPRRSPDRDPAMQGDPFGVARGSDGAYYFAMSAADNVQRLTPDGKATPLERLPARNSSRARSPPGRTTRSG